MVGPGSELSPESGLPKGFLVHYFKFNIGDYTSHTQHLTLMEDLAYRRLLDVYYLQERPLNAGITSVARQIRMRDNEAEIKVVLEEFFTLVDGCWRHERIEREINDYSTKVQQASNAGRTSAQRRLNARSTPVDVPLNQPLTTNQEPVTKNHKPTTPLPPEGFGFFWEKYPKKVGKPAALKAFKTAKLNGDLSAVLADIDRRMVGEDWRKEGGQYVPHPATYLNQRRWEDGETVIAEPPPLHDDSALRHLQEQRAMSKPPSEAIRARLAELTLNRLT
tara:strand:+ start:417 stop:1247 length:831 start_codon:yes stop_codon:yes gene_type:complete